MTFIFGEKVTLGIGANQLPGFSVPSALAGNRLKQMFPKLAKALEGVVFKISCKF